MKLGELGLSCRRTALERLRDSPHCPPLQHRALPGQVQPPAVEKRLFPRAEPQHADAEKQMSLSTSTGVTATRTAGDPSSATIFCPFSSKGQEHQPSRAVGWVTQAGVTLMAIPPPVAVVSISAARLLILTARHTL